jgi:hypothetical protein
MSASGYMKVVERLSDKCELDQECDRLRDSAPKTWQELLATQNAAIESLNRPPSEKDELLAILRQFRQELKAVGRVRDAHLIERAIDRVRRKQLTTATGFDLLP